MLRINTFDEKLHSCEQVREIIKIDRCSVEIIPECEIALPTIPLLAS